jgi:hypothetical protein
MCISVYRVNLQSECNRMASLEHPHHQQQPEEAITRSESLEMTSGLDEQ